MSKHTRTAAASAPPASRSSPSQANGTFQSSYFRAREQGTIYDRSETQSISHQHNRLQPSLWCARLGSRHFISHTRLLRMYTSKRQGNRLLTGEVQVPNPSRHGHHSHHTTSTTLPVQWPWYHRGHLLGLDHRAISLLPGHLPSTSAPIPSLCRAAAGQRHHGDGMPG